MSVTHCEISGLVKKFTEEAGNYSGKSDQPVDVLVQLGLSLNCVFYLIYLFWHEIYLF